MWKKLDFLLSENETKMPKNSIFSKSPQFSPEFPRNLKLQQTCQMESLGRNLGRGCPLWRSFWKFWPKMVKTNLDSPKNQTEKRIFSSQTQSNSTQNTSIDAPNTAVNNTRTPIANRSEHPRKSYWPQNWKNDKNPKIGTKNRKNWSTKTTFSQNVSRDLFIFSQI